MTDIVERLYECAHPLVADFYAEEMLEAAAEIERLRAVLESLTRDPPSTLASEPDTDDEVIIKMRAIARRALEPKP